MNSSDPFIQFKEVDRSISDFDRREQELTEKMQTLNRRLQDAELAKTGKNPKQIAAEIEALGKQRLSISNLLKESEKQLKALKAKVEDMPDRVDEVVTRKIERDHSDKHDRVKKLLALKYRAEAIKQLSKSQSLYGSKIAELEPRVRELAATNSKIEQRIATLSRVKDAVLRQSANPTSVDEIGKTFVGLDAEHDRLKQERSTFNRNDGKDGQKAKMRLQSEMIDKTNTALRESGFVDTLASIERTFKSLSSDIKGTEFTFIMRVASANKASILQAASPQDSVRLQIVEGDASASLNAEVDKISSALDEALNISFELAVSWWKDQKAARMHVDSLHSLLVTKFKYRFRRIWKEDLAQWIRKNLK